MNDEQRRCINKLRREGYVILTFHPTELCDVSVTEFEDKLIKTANTFIDKAIAKKAKTK